MWAAADGGEPRRADTPCMQSGAKGVATMKKLFAYGGIAASIVMVAFGTGSVVTGALGINEVRDNLSQEQIAFGDAAKDPAIPAKYSNAQVNTGAEARAFAKMMRVHALEASGGLVYAEMGRFTAKPDAPKSATDGNGGTSDEKYALIDETTSQPVSNGARNLWVTETALSTALNTAFFAERVAVFSIVMGVALLLTGIGFLILTLGGALGIVPLPKRLKNVETASATN
jgi:hypothetical protein